MEKFESYKECEYNRANILFFDAILEISENLTKPMLHIEIQFFLLQTNQCKFDNKKTFVAVVYLQKMSRPNIQDV